MTDRLTRAALRRGQSLHLHAGHAATIVATAGAVQIDYAPTWLGEQMLQEKISLQEGEAHMVRKTGWLAISTPADGATVCIVPRASLGTYLFALLARLVSRRHVQLGLHEAA